MENRAITANKATAKKGLASKFNEWFIESSVVSDIPVEVFTHKLVDSRFGELADDFTDELIRDIALNYEAFGDEISAYFDRRARLFSVIIALVVAWVFYVHPYNLTVSYLKNPEIAQQVVNQASETHSEYMALDETLNTLLSSSALSDDDTTTLKQAIEDFSKELDETQAIVKEQIDIGVPVGWPDTESTTHCIEQSPATDQTSGRQVLAIENCKLEIHHLGYVVFPSIVNALWLLFGGMLIGLGAPFWAQAVSHLTATRDISKRLRDIVIAEDESTPYFGNLKTTSIQTALPLRTFNIAKEVNSSEQ